MSPGVTTASDREVSETVVSTGRSSNSHPEISFSTGSPRKRSLLVLINLASLSITILMNVAVTIFGMGIGVGLILADSFRSQSPTQYQHLIASTSLGLNNSSATTIGADDNHQSNHSRSEETVTVSAETPTCRETIRRTMDRIQEAPPINIASMSTLPAQ